jgi:hypothetical protein
MTDPQHPAAIQHLPFFITAPGDTDTLLNVVGLFLLAMILLTGLLFFTLHTLPERLAHKSQKIQFEIVAVLGLLALFTHQHIFWVAGLLLAFVDLPDFSTPIGRMATALERIAGKKIPFEVGDEPWPVPPAESEEEHPVKLTPGTKRFG